MRCLRISDPAAANSATATSNSKSEDFKRSERRAPMGPPSNPPATSGTTELSLTSCCAICAAKPTGEVSKMAKCDVALMA